MIVVGATLCKFAMSIKNLWSYWLDNMEEIRKSHDIKIFCAIQIDKDGILPFKELIDKLSSLGGEYWTYSLDDKRKIVTSGNRYRHICAGRNLITDYAVTHRATHILFLDADSKPPTDVIPKLLEVDHPIVGGFLTTYCITGPLIDSYKFPVMDCGGSAGCFLVAHKIFTIVRWRWDWGKTDDPCYIEDAERLGYKIRIRKDCYIEHFPINISPLELRFGNKVDFSVSTDDV